MKKFIATRTVIYGSLCLFAFLLLPNSGFAETPCVSKPNNLPTAGLCAGSWDTTNGKKTVKFVLKKNGFSQAKKWKFVLYDFSSSRKPYCFTKNQAGNPDFVNIPNGGSQVITCSGLPNTNVDFLSAEFSYQMSNNVRFPRNVVYLTYPWR